MANALLNNGPGVVALASAGVGCVVLQETFGTHASRAGLAHSQASALGPLDVPRVPTDTKGLETIFSYDGWKVDANQIEENHASNPTKASAILDTMLFKQQVHGGGGDRSHPYIRKLDALTPTLSYAGWEADARQVEWPEVNFYDLMRTREQYVEIVLERMRRKQAVHSGDRSHPNLVKLDALKASLKASGAYAGWEIDAALAEKGHTSMDTSYPERSVAVQDTMLFKQQVHGGNGDRRHPFIRKLDALTPKLSYEGWEADAREVEWPVANIYDVIGSRAQYVEIVLERMRSKQAMVSGHLAIVSDLARSHPNLRKMLDERTGVGSRLETLVPDATDVTAPGA